jgi:hypothetical protein
MALIVAYVFFATSVWSLALPGEVLAGRNSGDFMSSRVLAQSLRSRLAAPISHLNRSASTNVSSSSLLAAPKAVTSLASKMPMAFMQDSGGATATVSFFGPEEFVRTTGDPNTYTVTVQVPAWVGNPFNLHIQSGEADGTNRVSSATILVNNVQVAGTSDFNVNVFTLDRTVTLTPTATLVVTLASKPGSYLKINLAGTNEDKTAPVLTIVDPATSSAINTPQAHLDIHYQDLPGAGEPAASGVNVNTLQVLLDGVDRTSLFTKRSDEATADLPASLALSVGPHTIAASIQDNAGNTAHATSSFQVDLTPPTMQILQPAAGSYLNTTTPQIQLAYSDNVAVNTGSLHVTVNGVDVSSQFSRTATGASATLSAPLAQGGNNIVATISDTAGNQTTASTVFNVDTTPPTITIVHPAAGSLHGSATVEFSIQFSDDQAIDTGSLGVTMDGNPLAATTTLTSASGSTTLADGNHTLAASIRDKAGNQASASSTFSVDTALPDIHIIQPAPGAILNNPTPVIQLQYSDPDIDTTSLKITVDGTDVSSLFTNRTATSASAALQTALADGSHTITAQIADQTGNVGQTSSSVLIDTIKPQITILAPVGAVNTLSPGASAQYSDSGSGIDPTSVHVFIDGTDVTANFAVAGSDAAGVLAGLAEGSHQFRVTVADKAGNVADVSTSFLVDVTPPQASFSSPANNAFINTPQPSVVLNYSDALSGINSASIHIFIQPLNGQETEITSLFTVGAGQASGTINPALADGTYHLLAQVADQAGNVANVDAAFALDTVAPTYIIQTPAANAFLKTATPTFVVTYQDNSSGVDPAQFALRVDGVDRTNRMTANDTGASGTLEAGDALPDGTHEVDVTVVDRAGNKAAIVQQPFLVDTTPPTIVFTTPTGVVYTNNNQPPIAVGFSDTGSGIDVTTFHLTIDGIDHTAEFTVTATGASGSPAAALPDGLHTIVATISDLAGNPSSATAPFTVDTISPQVTITQPANGLFTNAASLVVSGTVVDASPVTVTVEGTAVPVQGNTFTSAGITLGTTATQAIHVVATDAAGNATPVTLNINIDRTPPTITGVITPAPNGNGWNNTPVTVTFTCADDDSGVAVCPAPVQVSTEGANQAITGTATDKAGNSTQATVTVNIDETAPTIVGTPAPAPNPAGWNTTDVVITYVCADSLSGVVLCPASQVVSTEGKGQPITVSVSDKAGNTASSTVTLNIEKTAPTITGSVAPPPNAAGWNNTDVTVNFVCTASASDIVTCQPPVAVSMEGKGQIISGSVTDQAGKTGTTSVTVNLDKTPPLLSATPAPPPNAAGWNNTDVVISYACSDSLSGIAICPPPATVSTEGAAQPVNAQATDQAGNRSSITTTLNIDKTPPLVTATAAPSPNGAGWNNTNVRVNFSCTDNLSGVASCPQQTVVATEGQNQNISGQATDVAGNTATGSISLSIDKTPPTIVQLSTPDHISRLHGGQVSVTVNDNFVVSQVVITVNGTPLGTFTSAPYQADLEVPSGANPGDTLTVTAVATDEAGNTQTASRGVSVAADGVIVGQVLSDATSFPIQGAVVQALGASSVSDQTDDHGRYSLQASDSHLFLTVTSPSPATTTVEREVFVQEGVGTVPVDARLTPLAAHMAIGSAGGTLTAGNISVTVPAGVVGDGTSFQLTPLTGQGLPGLLPLGWSPLAAFDLRATSSAMNLSAAIAQMPNTVSHLVTYNAALHAWTMVTPNLQAVSGTVTVQVPSPGDYALAVIDNVTPAIPVPNPGDPLTGIDMQLLDPSASSSGSLSPAILPPSGGTSTATLGVQTTAAVPSGTVIQANISETFSLASGDNVSEQTRSEDIVLYGALAPANSALGAQFAVAPSHKYTNAQLLTGKVHLDILAGREGVRGQPGGSNPLTLSDGVSTLSVPGGALNEDTAISLQSISLEDFVPTTDSQSPIQEVLVDFSGDTLNTGAQLSISSSGLNPADTYLLTMVQRIDGVPHIVMVALAQINGSNLTSVASPGLPGVVQGGEYVFYDIPAPMGFVQGTVSSNAGPVQSLVQTDSLQIVSITGANGNYIVPALAGSANLKASAPHTNLLGSASVQVTEGQTVQANITLSGTVTSAVVSPADGSLGVPPSTTITITTTAPLNPQSIVQANLVLLQGTASSGTPVPVQAFVLSSSGTVLSFAPVSNLQPATQYTIQVSGLADTFGGAVVVPTSSFTTKAVAPLNFDPNAITFSFPDQNGNIQVSAPAGSLPPGTSVLIVDVSNGAVLSLTALNDGSLSGSFQGTINDVLQVTATDPNGATVNFARTQFVMADGTTAVGTAGGTVTGPGGVELRIDAGTFTQSATFKIQALAPSDFVDHPQFEPDAVPAGGIRVNFNGTTPFNQEIHLAFAKPAGAPDGATYFVFRRLLTPNGDAVYEVIDEASQDATDPTKIVTHSPPYRGFINFTNAFNTLTNTVDLVPGMLQAQADFAIEYVQDIVNSFKIQSGAILGVVRRADIPANGGETTFDPVADATVQGADDPQLVDPTTKKVVTTTDSLGRFTLWDPNYDGGTRRLLVTSAVPQSQGGPQTLNILASEVTPGDDISVIPDILRSLFAPFLTRYRNVAYANATFPAILPPPSAPALQIQLYQTTSSGQQLLTGVAPTNTDLTVVIRSTTADIPFLSVQSLGTLAQPVSIAVQPAGNDGAFSLFNATYNTPNQGLFRIQATVLPPLGGNPVIATYDFRAIQGALNGGNNTDDPNNPPAVIYTLPHGGEQFVDVRITPQVFFSEPVTNITNSTVMLSEVVGGVKGGAVSAQISGVAPDGSLINSVGSKDIVTSILIQPNELLQYSQTYALSFDTAILDTDKDQNGNPAPKNLVSTPDITFQTQGPEIESRPKDVFPSPGVFVANNTAFLEKVSIPSLYDRGFMTMYDVSNPVQPLSISPSLLLSIRDPILGRPVAITGEDNNAIAIAQGSKTLIAVAASSYATPRPSNVHLYTDDGNRKGNTYWIGSVSLSTNPIDGMVNSIVVRADRIYAATMRKGIQVVDIHQMLADVQERLTDPAFGILNYLARQATINRDLYTEGQGFATDAVVNTIPVSAPVPCPSGQTNGAGTCNEEFKANIVGIKVSDYVVEGESATWVIGTGFIQPASNAPSGSNPATIVAVNPATNDVFRNTPDDGAGTFLLRGTAIDLAQVQNSDLPNVSNIAVVVGDSASSGVMFILDMTDPRSPTTLSMTPLDLSLGEPTDVLVRDKVAAVAFEHVTVLYDISDPTNPQSLGKVGSDSDPVGGKIAFSSDGSMMYSSAFVPGAVDPSEGLHITEFNAGAFVNFIPPVLSKEDKPSNPNSTRTNEVDFEIDTIMVPTVSKVDSAQLQLFANGNPIPCPGTNPPTATCPVTLSGTAGKVMFKAESLTKQPADLTAQVTYNVHNSNPLVSAQVPFHLGVVKILADLNNDTVVDDKDLQLQQSNWNSVQIDQTNNADVTTDANIKRFSFWQSDSSKLGITLIPTEAGTSVLSSSVQEDALADYATLKIHTEALPPAGYTLAIKLQNAEWALTEKAPGPSSCTNSGCTQVDIPLLLKSKEHLSDPNTVQAQLGRLNNGTKLCTNSIDTSGTPGECTSDSSGVLTLDNLTLGDTVTLFRCSSCGMRHFDNSGNPLDGNRTMEVQVQQSGAANSSAKILDHLDVDLRPFSNWVGAYTARDAQNSDVPNQVLQPVPNWQNNIPSNSSVNVLVHGFNVSANDALTGFIPTYTKRLYWTSYPVLPSQNTDKGPAYTVGILWKGDHRDWLQNLSIAAFLNGLYFPDDEFNALETGDPLAAFLSQVKNQSNTINIIAHSLGNMVVNSAISQAPTGTVTSYVMNDGAIAAEVFDSNFFGIAPQDPNAPGATSLNDEAFAASQKFVVPYMQPFRMPFLTAHLTQMGLPDDAIWDAQWNDVQSQDGPLQVYNNFYFNGSSISAGDAQLDYTHRWRPASHGFGHGPWLGVFGNNKNLTTIYNSFDMGDCVLDQAWFFNQLIQKPDRMFFDSMSAITTAFDNTNDPFPASNRIDNTQNQLWILRSATQFGRLAQWYPARTGAVGAYGYPEIFGSDNVIDLTDIATDSSTIPCSSQTSFSDTVTSVPTTVGLLVVNVPVINPIGVIQLGRVLAANIQTHTYMTSQPFSRVWRGYKRILPKLYNSTVYPNFHDPDPSSQ